VATSFDIGDLLALESELSGEVYVFYLVSPYHITTNK
jgi:hypothetical protein